MISEELTNPRIEQYIDLIINEEQTNPRIEYYIDLHLIIYCNF